MSGRRVENLTEHYLGSSSFDEAESSAKNRFLDEVVRRYTREANKRYFGEDKYILTYDSASLSGDPENPTHITFGVYLCNEWSLHPYLINGRGRRVSPNGTVTISTLLWEFFKVHLNYPACGSLGRIDLSFCSSTGASPEFIKLSTNVNAIGPGNFNYHIPKFHKIITKEEYGRIRTNIVGAVSGSEPATVFVRKMRNIFEPGTVLEPKNQIIGNAVLIETKEN